LRHELRAAAYAANPLQSLGSAAVELALGNVQLGHAYADLTVTGHRSLARFHDTHPDPRAVAAQARTNPRTAALSDAALQTAAGAALDRAFAVANALRIGGTSTRATLGWIAVSAEDDSPY